MTSRLRFAPSPTGLMHIGNARQAVINALYAGALGGEFWLRLDDTDTARSKEEYAQAIRDDLDWLGLVRAGEVRQSDRLALYEKAFDDLRAAGRVYPCYETPEELELKRKRLLAAGKPPVYDRSALALDDAARADLEAQGRTAHWRFKLDHAEIRFTDAVRGEVMFHGENLSDPVIRRADGSFLYLLPSAVDDVEMGITHVVRGEDHVTNTAIQIQMMEALGAKAIPTFAHMALLTDAQGGGLSKRLGSLSLSEMRAAGTEPMAVVSLLAALGSSEAVEPVADMVTLVARFDIGHFSRAAAKFDPQDLARLNTALVHALPEAEAVARLAAMGLGADDGARAAFWSAVHANLATMEEARDWWAICFDDALPCCDATSAEDQAFLSLAATHLPPEPWDTETWSSWTGSLKQASGRKGKALFMPLRKALTGREKGPELNGLLPLMGRERVLARIAR